ncbi:MAG: hypothetical protein AB7G44_07305 [Bacteroidia bacterium]
MAKKKYKEKEKKAEVNEPQQAYGEKEMMFFNSFEEQENDNYRWLATLTPEQHLNYTVQLIKRVYSEQLKENPKTGNTLIFD